MPTPSTALVVRLLSEREATWECKQLGAWLLPAGFGLGRENRRGSHTVAGLSVRDAVCMRGLGFARHLRWQEGHRTPEWGWVGRCPSHRDSQQEAFTFLSPACLPSTCL